MMTSPAFQTYLDFKKLLNSIYLFFINFKLNTINFLSNSCSSSNLRRVTTSSFNASIVPTMVPTMVPSINFSTHSTIDIPTSYPTLYDKSATTSIGLEIIIPISIISFFSIIGLMYFINYYFFIYKDNRYNIEKNEIDTALKLRETFKEFDEEKIKTLESENYSQDYHLFNPHKIHFLDETNQEFLLKSDDILSKSIKSSKISTKSYNHSIDVRPEALEEGTMSISIDLSCNSMDINDSLSNLSGKSSDDNHSPTRKKRLRKKEILRKKISTNVLAMDGKSNSSLNNPASPVTPKNSLLINTSPSGSFFGSKGTPSSVASRSSFTSRSSPNSEKNGSFSSARNIKIASISIDEYQE